MGILRQNKSSCSHKLCFIKAKIVSAWETNPCSGAISPMSFPLIIATDLYYCRNKDNEAKASEVKSAIIGKLSGAQWEAFTFPLKVKQLIAVDANIHR